MSSVLLFPSGFLIIDKPEGWTSFDVIAKLRRLTGVSRIGHLGTLDPLATGVLVVAIGEGTKLIEYFMRADKVYEVTAEIGKVSDTYDSEGKITVLDHAPDLFSESKLRALLPEFCGDSLQVPPAHSAIKIKGRPAYALARVGEKLELSARPVRIHDIEFLSCTVSGFSLRVRCGSGTYIRSLVHDLGQRLGTGALMTQLLRLYVGFFSLETAVTVEASVQTLEAAVIPLEKVVEGWPSFTLDEALYVRLRHGQTIGIDRGSRRPLHPAEPYGASPPRSLCSLDRFPSVTPGTPVAAFYQNRLVSIVTPDVDRIKVLKNLVLK